MDIHSYKRITGRSRLNNTNVIYKSIHFTISPEIVSHSFD